VRCDDSGCFAPPPPHY
jgi:hypothetical protein